MIRNLFCFLFAAFLMQNIHAGNILWASKVISYSSQLDYTSYSAKQVLGEPSRLPTYGDCGCAWSPSMSENYFEEYIRVGFERKIHVAQIIVSENFNAGAIKAIYLFDQYNLPHLVYKREDSIPEWKLGNVLNITIPATDFATNDLKLVLDTESIDGFNQIDAIGIAEVVSPIPKGDIVTTNKIEFKGKPQNMGKNLNSFGSEIMPLVTPDGKTLYFTRKNHMGNMGTIMNDDIWVSNYNGTEWSEAENIGSPINNDANNYVVGISENGNLLTLANTYSITGESRVGIAQTWKAYGGASWVFPKNLVTPGVMTHNLYAEYFMNEDRSVLILALERADSYGMKDIYVSFSDNQIYWSDPINLGTTINSASNEMAPFLAPDGKTLFFSSNGYPGYGDQDIYVAERLDSTWQNWSRPENIGSMVNTKGFDAYFSYPDTADYAYFASTGDDLMNVDLMRIPLREAPEEEDSLTVEDIAIINDPLNVNYELEKINSTIKQEEIPSFEDEVVIPEKKELETDLDNDILLFGTVYDASTKLPIDASITFILNEYVADPIKMQTLNNTYRLKITDNVSYNVSVIREGYLPLKTTINITDFREQKVKKIDFELIPYYKGEKIILDNLYFDANRSTIKPESFEEIDRLYQFLIANPGAVIEIGGHTNGLCSDSFCDKLSQNRANAVREYLILKGIDPVRLTAVGYGSRSPIDTNSTPEGRKRNQRVEITFR